ncbi:universal stress protein in QAH/OAS sulfhydrylase 3'region-like isoform X1 [Haliotis rufescens]|uniref:universal stress protein in QAH/OAS sulfhydrylase 3'region-like isoform X1 n=1 Tax=Haliotis rufescens TaxID=6454 RepID=UPI00201F758A|nr:universal stress protein in QAH/OAS sulfhydrylase 3'region-like isoform X1 [Haliotis rufescens]
MATEEARNVVIAVDDSEFSEYAFDFYVQNVHHPGDNITLVHCSEYASLIHAPALLTDPVVVAELIKEEEVKVKHLVEKYSEKMKKIHVGGKVKQMTGKVGEAIVEAAKGENAAMIVVGTRGMGKIRRTFLGSVSDYCLHHSPVPVLVCRHKPVSEHKK